MKILLPVDGSEYTKRMLAYVAAHHELFGPDHDYTMFTAVPPAPASIQRIEAVRVAIGRPFPISAWNPTRRAPCPCPTSPSIRNAAS